MKRLILVLGLLISSPLWAAFRAIGTATSIATGVAGSITPGSPAGLAANDIIICVALADAASITFTATGFTALTNTSLAAPDGESVSILWKRAAGGDSLAITRSGTAGSAVAQCAAWSGRDTSNNPVGSTAATSTASNASPLTVPANGVTALASDDLVWIAGLDITVANPTLGQTPPTGYTNRSLTKDTADGFNVFVINTQDAVSAGATGTVSGTVTYSTGGSGYAAFLVRIPVAVAFTGLVRNVGFKGKIGLKGKIGIK